MFFSDSSLYLFWKQRDQTYKYILCNNVWVLTHRLHKKHLRRQESRVSVEAERDQQPSVLAGLQHLEPVLFRKLDDRPSSFSGCVCGIKDLKQHEKQLFICSSVMVAALSGWELTATWPPSTLRYWRTSFSAAMAHWLWRDQTQYDISKFASVRSSWGEIAQVLMCGNHFSGPFPSNLC